MAVRRIERISFTTADPAALASFYVQAFGFERIGIEQHEGEDFSQLMGLPRARARTVLLRLGRELLELVAFADAGAPYPRDSASNDVIFQHIAIVVSDMQGAFARLSECRGWTAITSPVPQRLPARSGGVTAFKFRDPEGHPLELLAFAAGHVAAPWDEAHADRLCLGIDHSAIVVTDTERSAAFYRDVLGFADRARSLNHGIEQDRLDGLSDAVVEVTGLAPKPDGPPRLELLRYRSPSMSGAPAKLPSSNDVAATRLVLEIEDVAALVRQLSVRDIGLVSTRAPVLHGGRNTALIRDPDGHALMLVDRTREA